MTEPEPIYKLWKDNAANPDVLAYLKDSYEKTLLFDYRQSIQRAKHLEKACIELGLVKRPKLT